MFSKAIEFNELLDISPDFFYESLANIPAYLEIKCLIRPVLDEEKNELRTRKQIFVLLQDELLATLIVSILNSDRIKILMFRIKNDAIENIKSIRTVQWLAKMICDFDPKHTKANYYKAFDYWYTLSDDLMDILSDEFRRSELGHPGQPSINIGPQQKGKDIPEAVINSNKGGAPGHAGYKASYEYLLKGHSFDETFAFWRDNYPDEYGVGEYAQKKKNFKKAMKYWIDKVQNP